MTDLELDAAEVRVAAAEAELDAAWPDRLKHDREGIRWLPIEATPLGKEWSG